MSKILPPVIEELREKVRPLFETGKPLLSVVDLFSGCGGMTLGIAQGLHFLGFGTEIKFAVEFEKDPADVYARNFPSARSVKVQDVRELFLTDLGAVVSPTESLIKDEIGSLDILVGGPPCQGHSNLNNHTRRNDPKNNLYSIMARAAIVLRPRVVIIENVPSVIHDRYGGENAVEVAQKHLKAHGYQVKDVLIDMVHLGIPQTRKRHLLIAVQATVSQLDKIIWELKPRAEPNKVSLEDVIGDLRFSQSDSIFDSPSNSSPANKSRMQYLFDNDLYDLPNKLRPRCHQGNHSYKSMYGRLNWCSPAQTITSGFGSPGQGRYIHPSEMRTITPHEAARIQGFPDYFDFSSVEKRGQLSRMIGNAVPPALARKVIVEIARVISLESQGLSSLQVGGSEG